MYNNYYIYKRNELASLAHFFLGFHTCLKHQLMYESNCIYTPNPPWIQCCMLIYLYTVEKFTCIWITICACAAQCLCVHMHILPDHVTSQRNLLVVLQFRWQRLPREGAKNRITHCKKKRTVYIYVSYYFLKTVLSQWIKRCFHSLIRLYHRWISFKLCVINLPISVAYSRLIAPYTTAENALYKASTSLILRKRHTHVTLGRPHY